MRQEQVAFHPIGHITRPRDIDHLLGLTGTTIPHPRNRQIHG
ncbi:hypothetical protein ABZ571_35440 [Streptomyces sp. NPDC013130]